MKTSFIELVKRFTEKFGADYCKNTACPEAVLDLFLDYVKSQAAESIDYETVRSLM